MVTVWSLHEHHCRTLGLALLRTIVMGFKNYEQAGARSVGIDLAMQDYGYHMISCGYACCMDCL